MFQANKDSSSSHKERPRNQLMSEVLHDIYGVVGRAEMNLLGSGLQAFGDKFKHVGENHVTDQAAQFDLAPPPAPAPTPDAIKPMIGDIAAQAASHDITATNTLIQQIHDDIERKSRDGTLNDLPENS